MKDTQDRFKSAYEDAEKNESIREWYRLRVESLKDSIKAHDVLRHFGVDLKMSGSTHEEQLQCPFHGNDVKPSARVYPDGPRSSSSVWCFVCAERWDIFKLWKKFKGDQDISFSSLLFQIEQEFGVSTPEAPVGGFHRKENDAEVSQQDRVTYLYEVCEKRLKASKRAFTMDGYLLVSSLLDKIYYQMELSQGCPPELETGLRMVLEKIGEKERKSDAS